MKIGHEKLYSLSCVTFEKSTCKTGTAPYWSCHFLLCAKLNTDCTNFTTVLIKSWWTPLPQHITGATGSSTIIPWNALRNMMYCALCSILCCTAQQVKQCQAAYYRVVCWRHWNIAIPKLLTNSKCKVHVNKEHLKNALTLTVVRGMGKVLPIANSGTSDRHICQRQTSMQLESTEHTRSSV